MIGKLLTFVVGREPVAVGGLVTAALALAVAFGLDITEEQLAALVAVTTALITLAQRQAVTPVARVTVPDERGDVRLGVVVFAILIVLAFIGLLQVCDDDDRDGEIGWQPVAARDHEDEDRNYSGSRNKGRDSRGDCENSAGCSDDDASPRFDDSPVIVCLPGSTCQF
jgi:hypothetical protein